ncbi:MAG: hypothetical protein COT38_01245 [Candidatus Omnitrophica bacterium CG08_land_8_20_14_0_20_41_16]|uniref:Uncharacterized protein n=1 Tax=Candidatus Sherwoodlollariibacterium unditelluris TaxID=1974757 RepID=A0A2G9YHS5_9BACT|nr:MAG: hypothetical protein COX41_06215 [Candidatus Omnitrophica bacterium CG23_combo_of_CG06-09_8_20_14_all_41_10]PIS34217.1 MAG: hypothetical protein COT38_01245 [Candidatus Omnitrophica bacterium CG08_land_8_20_14_0_20_41_16]
MASFDFSTHLENSSGHGSRSRIQIIKNGLIHGSAAGEQEFSRSAASPAGASKRCGEKQTKTDAKTQTDENIYCY